MTIRFVDLPTTLAEALDAFEQDRVVQEALGIEYARQYLRVKREEWLFHNRMVTSWERDHYLATY